MGAIYYTVEITKSKNDNLWYRNKIGKRFRVKDEDPKDNRFYLKPYNEEGNAQKIIYKEDCKIIK